MVDVSLKDLLDEVNTELVIDHRPDVTLHYVEHVYHSVLAQNSKQWHKNSNHVCLLKDL